MERIFLKACGIAACAALTSLSAVAADYTVKPAEGTVSEVGNFEITFAGNDVMWTAAAQTREGAPKIEWNGQSFLCTNQSAKGATLSFGVLEPYTNVGDYTVRIPAGSYLVSGMEGAEIVLSYNVDFNPNWLQVSPAENIVPELQHFSLTFTDANSVVFDENSPRTSYPRLEIEVAPGQWEVRDYMLPTCTGNAMGFKLRSPETMEGQYRLIVEGSTYTLDGVQGRNIELNYQIVDSEPGIMVDPAPGVVPAIAPMTITFRNAEKVEWNADVQSRTNYPFITWNGIQVATVTGLTAEGNVLSMACPEYTNKGEYLVTIPAGMYLVDGEYGSEIVVNYTIEESLDYVTISPAIAQQTELQFFQLTFNDAQTVGITENLATSQCPHIDLETAPGQWDVRAYFSDMTATGNSIGLALPYPLSEEGTYRLVVPGNTYALDNRYAGRDLEFTYEVIANDGPVTITPAPGEIEVLGAVALTFNQAAQVEWDIVNMTSANAPYVLWNGEKVAMVNNLEAAENVLTLNIQEFTNRGAYQVVVPAGSYKVDGQEGSEITIDYTIAESIDYVTISPAIAQQVELQYFSLTFNDAATVTVVDAESLNPEDLPRLEREVVAGQWESAGELTASCVGNNMGLALPTYVDAEGTYRLIVPGTFYVLDGSRNGRTLEFTYEVIDNTLAPYTEVIPAQGEIAELAEVKIVFEANQVVEWSSDLSYDNVPYVQWNGQTVGYITPSSDPAATTGLLTETAALILRPVNPFTAKGAYTVVVPATSYTINGNPGSEIRLDYNIEQSLNPVTIDPSQNLQVELESFSITFNDATLVEVVENAPLPRLERETAPGQWENTVGLTFNTAGNQLGLLLDTYVNTPGDYRLVIPGAFYTLDGVQGTDLEFTYVIFEGTTNYNVIPAQGEVEQLDRIEITFDTTDIEWSPELSTASAPVVKWNGLDFAHITNLSVEGSSLVLQPYAPITEHGDFEVIIPAGSYFRNGVAGQEIVLNYTIGFTGWDFVVSPAISQQAELECFSVVITNATTVEIADALTLTPADFPTLDFFDVEKAEWENVYTFTTASAYNNSFGLQVPFPVNNPGDYRLVIPGNFYTIDGKPGETLNLTYEVYGLTASVEATPAQGEVSELDQIVLTFNTADNVAWNEGAEAFTAPVLANNDGQTAAELTLTAEENTLVLTAKEKVDGAGAYTLTVFAGSYLLDGIEGSIDLEFKWIITTSGIQAVFGNATEFTVCDLNGRMLNSRATVNDLKALKGLYIINGKKCILR